MKTAIALAAIVFLLALNGFVTLRVVRARAIFGTAHSVAWLLFIWLVPLIGAVLAFQVSTEKDIPAPAPTAREEGSQVQHLDGGNFV